MEGSTYINPLRSEVYRIFSVMQDLNGWYRMRAVALPFALPDSSILSTREDDLDKARQTLYGICKRLIAHYKKVTDKVPHCLRENPLHSRAGRPSAAEYAGVSAKNRAPLRYSPKSETLSIRLVGDLGARLDAARGLATRSEFARAAIQSAIDAWSPAPVTVATS